MVFKKTRVVATTAATFGIALSSVYVANEIQADVLDITYDGGNATMTNPFVANGGVSVFIDQIDNAIVTSSLGATSSAGQFFHWNDTFGTDGVGRTMELGLAAEAAGPMSMRLAAMGEVIDPATFAGEMNTAGTAPADIGNAGNGPTSNTTFHGTGSAFIAVRPFEAPGNLYWFKVSFSDGGPMIYREGQYGSMGEALTVGNKVPCDNPLGDVNGDGEVTLLDVQPFVNAIQEQTFICEADVNQDTVVDLLDVQPFVAILQGGG